MGWEGDGMWGVGELRARGRERGGNAFFFISLFRWPRGGLGPAAAGRVHRNLWIQVFVIIFAPTAAAGRGGARCACVESDAWRRRGHLAAASRGWVRAFTICAKRSERIITMDRFNVRKRPGRGRGRQGGPLFIGLPPPGSADALLIHDSGHDCRTQAPPPLEDGARPAAAAPERLLLLPVG